MLCRPILLSTCSLRQSAAAAAQPGFPLRARLRQRLDLDRNDMLGIDHDRILAPLSSYAALFIGHTVMSVCRTPLRCAGRIVFVKTDFAGLGRYGVCEWLLVSPHRAERLLIVLG